MGLGVLDALYNYVENVCKVTQIQEAKNMAAPHLMTVQFSKILPLRNTENCEKRHVFCILDTAIYHYVFILKSPCRIPTFASECKKVQLLTSALVFPSSHKLT